MRSDGEALRFLGRVLMSKCVWRNPSGPQEEAGAQSGEGPAGPPGEDAALNLEEDREDRALRAGTVHVRTGKGRASQDPSVSEQVRAASPGPGNGRRQSEFCSRRASSEERQREEAHRRAGRQVGRKPRAKRTIWRQSRTLAVLGSVAEWTAPGAGGDGQGVNPGEPSISKEG